MSDNLNDKLNEERAAAEAARRAERIKAIRASLHSADETAAPEPVKETAPEPVKEAAPEPAEESFAEKFRRVRESKLAAMNAPAESAPAEAAGEKRSRSHRGGRSHRRGGRGRGGETAEKPGTEAGVAVHTKEKAPQKLVAHAVVPGDKPAAEKHADGEKTGGTRRRRPRGGRNHRRGGGSAAPKAEN
jgi:hypothetical protein